MKKSIHEACQIKAKSVHMQAIWMRSKTMKIS